MGKQNEWSFFPVNICSSKLFYTVLHTFSRHISSNCLHTSIYITYTNSLVRLVQINYIHVLSFSQFNKFTFSLLSVLEIRIFYSVNLFLVNTNNKEKLVLILLCLRNI